MVGESGDGFGDGRLDFDHDGHQTGVFARDRFVEFHQHPEKAGDRLLCVGDRFLHGVAFGDAAGEERHGHGVPAFVGVRVQEHGVADQTSSLHGRLQFRDGVVDQRSPPPP